jgi:hypothetical protein
MTGQEKGKTKGPKQNNKKCLWSPFPEGGVPSFHFTCFWYNIHQIHSDWKPNNLNVFGEQENHMGLNRIARGGREVLVLIIIAL